ncbi:iron-containing alcohol dehydrogenase [Inquilinus sp. OTU3971]|uniref:iron-containing alcohol dehydrogenase n=1 Tax=Inquilinus sp. OTU3971 TaxID=3043855 RepID=UPI00313EDABB
MTVSIHLPRILRIGAGASAELAQTLATLGLSRPLIVTDGYLLRSGRAERLATSLKKAGIASRVFSETVPEPTVGCVEAARDVLLAGDHDCVVGFGGGSPIDSAKAIAVLSRHGGEMSDYRTPFVQDTPGLPIIAVPTTAGTGSEATRFTVITDDLRGEKMLCAGLAYLPIAALVDYELTLTMPPRLTADTGLDALTHGIEAYVSRRANPFSDTFALAALRSIAPSLRRVWADPMDREARARMMLGATQAGIAFSNSSVALVHGMSRPIGAHFHVPHGLSNAMLLPVITTYSMPAAVGRYADCARAMGLADGGDGDEAAAERLVGELARLNADLAVPTPRTYGIDERRWNELIPLMAEQALASGSPANNPVVPTADEVVSLYRRTWNA